VVGARDCGAVEAERKESEKSVLCGVGRAVGVETKTGRECGCRGVEIDWDRACGSCPFSLPASVRSSPCSRASAVVIFLAGPSRRGGRVLLAGAEWSREVPGGAGGLERRDAPLSFHATGAQMMACVRRRESAGSAISAL
jgi:hypothetical protein